MQVAAGAAGVEARSKGEAAADDGPPDTAAQLPDSGISGFWNDPSPHQPAL